MRRPRLYSLLYILLALSPVMVAGYANAELVKGQTLTVAGIERTYDVYSPNIAVNGPRPLVLLLHGHSGDADTMTGENRKAAPYKHWLSIADREGWYVVIPNGEYGSDNQRGWNDCRQDAETNPTTDDVGFLNALVDEISSKYAVDQNRIYAHGTSNGGMMVFRLAQESGGKFKAVASIVALMPEITECKPVKHPISVMLMNGTKDPILPYEGGRIGRRASDQEARGTVVSTDESIEVWLDHNDIRSRPTVRMLPNLSRFDRSRVQVQRYTGDHNNTEVVLYKVVGGGHTEPSLTEHFGRIYKAIVGRQNRDIEMAEEVWKFFERNQ